MATKPKLTSVKVLPSLYEEFKEFIKHQNNNEWDDINFQKVVNRSLFLLMHDEDFAQKILEAKELYMASGSYY